MAEYLKELAESLAQDLAVSLSGRDWEDSVLEEAMSYRRDLARQLVSLGEQAVDALVGLLANADWAIRDDAAILLGTIKSLRAIAPLLAVLEKDDSLSVRLSAASTLERINTPETIRATRDWYRQNQITAQRRLAVKIAEYTLYGSTDAILLERARQIAERKNVSVALVFQSKSHLDMPYSAQRRADTIRMLGLVELSEQEVAALEEPYQLV